MLPAEKDASCLWDMLEAARGIESFTAGVAFEQYQDNRMMQLAVERQLEIAGEAAKNLSAEFRTAHPEIPWASIIAQRNVIAHEYGEIRHERIWGVIKNRVPALIKRIEPLIP